MVPAGGDDSARVAKLRSMEIRKSPALLRDPADEPQIDTPIIDIQDLEHQPGASTRMNNAGIEVLPQMNLSKEDEKARSAIEELERALKNPL
jgi:hypothetical protein